MAKVKSIEGIQELQDYNIRAIAELKPDGVVGKAVRYGLTVIHRYAVSVTHVVTGALRASHEMEFRGSESLGIVSIRGDTTNPRTGARPSIYGVTEHERGGSHAFYQRTVEEAGRKTLEEMADMVKGELKS